MSGNEVKNVKKEHLGEIKDLMVNLHDGKIAYAVLSFGGFLGIGDKLFAVPWSSLKLDQESKCFIMNADEEFLKNSPGFDKSDWPSAHHTAYLDKVFTHYGQPPFWVDKVHV